MTTPAAPEAPAGERVGAGRPRWLPWLAVATAALLTGLAAAWWLFWTAPVVYRGGFGVTFHDAEPGRAYTVSLEGLCLDGAESAVIEDVIVDRAGLTVVDFAVRPRPKPPALGLGSGPFSLADAGSGNGRSLTGQCDDGANTELAVELRKDDAIGPAHTGTIDVHWSAGLRSGVLSVPVSVTLCPAGDATELCADAP